MINLLSPSSKSELRAARTNALLVRYNVLMLVAIAFLGLAVGYSYFTLASTKASAEQTIQDNNAKVVGFAKVKQEASQFRQDLTTAKQILGQEVSYSSIALQISALMPPGTVLSNLALDAKTFGTPTSLSAAVRDYSSALALKNSFQKSPLFSDVHFESITGSESNKTYPLNVTLSVTIKKGTL